MRIEVYNECAEKNVVRLDLRECDNKVTVVAVNLLGAPLDAGNIVTISSGGIMLHANINPSLGLPLDEQGCIKVVS